MSYQRVARRSEYKAFEFDEATQQRGRELEILLPGRSAITFARGMAVNGQAVLIVLPDGSERVYTTATAQTLWPYRLRCAGCGQFVKHPKAARSCIACSRRARASSEPSEQPA